MTEFISNAAAIVLCDALVDRLDAGAGAATLVIYDGAVPTDADTALSGNNVLATLTFTDPAFGNAGDNTPGALATASAITSDTSANAGTASVFRIFDSNSLIVLQGSVGTSGEDINLNSVIFSAGQTVALTALTVEIEES